MKLILLNLLAAGMSLALALEVVPRSAVAMRCTTPPKLDGVLDDPCWAAAECNSDYVVYKPENNYPRAQVQTTFRVLYDETHLYLGFVCQEPEMQHRKAAARLRDSPVIQDDSVELFLSKGESVGPYYQIAINSLGTIYDADSTHGVEPNLPFQVAARCEADRWVLEISLEIAGLESPTVPTAAPFRISFCRNRYATGQVEYTHWTILTCGFHDPAHFGLLILDSRKAFLLQTLRPRLMAMQKTVQASGISAAEIVAIENRLHALQEELDRACASETVPPKTFEQLYLQIGETLKATEEKQNRLELEQLLEKI